MGGTSTCSSTINALAASALSKETGMPIPEGYLPREGDVVVVHATVKYDVDPKTDSDEDGPKVFIRPIGGYTDHRVPVKTLVGLYSRHFEEGERVRMHADPTATGTVLATYEHLVWVKFERLEDARTIPANSLEPIPERDEPPVDTSDIPETPKSFFENATLVAPAMRFSVGETATLARLPEDPNRSEEIAKYIGHSVSIFSIEGSLYRAHIVNGPDFFASDDMLDEPTVF
jgi:hypothetical protein